MLLDLLGISGHGPGIHALTQVLAHLEKWETLGSHVNGISSAWIATFIGFVFTNREAAKPTNFDALSLLQGLDHRIEDAVDDLLCFAVGQLELFRDLLDELGFRQTPGNSA